jgi:hypothetical protein
MEDKERIKATCRVAGCSVGDLMKVRESCKL